MFFKSLKLIQLSTTVGKFLLLTLIYLISDQKCLLSLLIKLSTMLVRVMIDILLFDQVTYRSVVISTSRSPNMSFKALPRASVFYPDVTPKQSSIFMWLDQL